MRRARSSSLIPAAVLLSLSACRSGDDARGVPPATAWKSPEVSASEVAPGGGPAPVPAAEATPDDPHAGIDMNALGGPGNDPHAGLNGDRDPHAGLDLDGEGAPPEGEDPAMANLLPPDPDRPIDPSKVLGGAIRADKALAARVAPGSLLFVTAWPIDPSTEEILGSPVAAARLVVDQLPLAFELTERDVMVAGTRFEGEVLLSARVDTDGDGEARTRAATDLEGRVRATIPARGVEVVLVGK